MRTVPLQQICDIQIGKTPSRSVPEYWGGELPWVTISDFAAGRIVTTTQERITRIGAAKSGSKRIPRGTLLLSFKLSLGKRALSGCDLFTNEAIAALHVLDHDVADRDYLYWALGSIDYDRLVDRAAKGKTLNKAKLKILKIPLPPLDEQRRIAAILDAADALRDKRREALTQLDTLLQCTFLNMFGDPVTNPMGWDASPLADFCKTGTGGTPSRGKMQRYYEGGTIPWVKSGELREEVITSTGEHITETALKETNVKLVPKDALLLALYGATVGRLGILGIQATTNQAVCHIIPNTLRVDLRYMFHSLSNQVSYLIGRGVGGAQPNISQGIIKSLAIPLPPLDLQHRFAAIVESVEHQKASQRAHLAELDTLFASLQSRAFRGDL